jgi:hypothetical protein
VVDFRYHLISIVAVFLALGIGILLGSGLLGERLVEGLEGEVRDVQDTNDRLQQVISEQDTGLRQLERFVDAIQPWIIDGALQDDDIVVLTFQGVDGDVLDGIRGTLEQAGATISSTIVMRDELALEADEDAAVLAGIIGTTSEDAAELNVDSGRVIGRAAGKAESGESLRSEEGIDGDLNQLMGALQRENFVDIESPEEGQIVPVGADFVIVGGSTDQSAFDTERFTLALTGGLADHGADVLAAETADSQWNLVPALLRDPRLSSEIATVDNADTTMGEIAVVLAIDEANAGSPGHYGYDDGAVAPVPESTVAD